MPLKMSQFENYARNVPPSKTVLLRGLKWRREELELYALLLVRHVTLPQFPDTDFLSAEIEPLCICDRKTGTLDTNPGVTAGLEGYNRFCLYVEKDRGKCRFGPTRFPGLEHPLQSFGMGPRLFKELIEYGQLHYAGFGVSPAHLDLAAIRNNQTLVNVFCHILGFEAVTIEEREEVTVLTKGISRLTPYCNTKRVTELDIPVPPEACHPSVDRPRLTALLRDAGHI